MGVFSLRCSFEISYFLCDVFEVYSPSSETATLQIYKGSFSSTYSLPLVSSRRRRMVPGIGGGSLSIRPSTCASWPLNFWHADFKFVPIESLALEPSSQQQEILARLRNQLRAFGSSGDAFSVPQSGRRITTLVSLLADLSEFVTWEGIGGDAYSRTFPGAVAGFGHLAKVERDLERAEELRPYRSLDPSRLTLSGTASWDPEPYLSDLLWMAFNEPESLRWAAQERSCNVPDLSKESYDLTKDLALLWDINGLALL